MDTLTSHPVLVPLATRPELVAIAIAVAMTALVGWVTYSFFLSPCAHVPGPLLVRLGLTPWLTMRSVKSDMLPQIMKAHQQYGRVVRIGRSHISTVDPEAITPLYRAKGGFEKTPFYFPFRGVKGDALISIQSNKIHAKLRAIEQPAHSPASIMELEHFIDPLTSKFFDLVESLTKDGKVTVDMTSLTQSFAFDVVGELTFGRSFDMLNSGGNDPLGILPLIRDFVFIIPFCGSQPWLFEGIFPFLSRVHPGLSFVNKVTHDSVGARYEVQKTGEARPDILTKLISLKNDDGSPWKPEQVEAEALAIVGAGSDTTAITMRAIMYFLVKNPTVYAKIQDEIDTAVAEGRVHLPVHLAEGQKLPYLSAVIKETQRLHPGILWPLPRYVPEGGITIDDIYLPAGTTLATGAYIHRFEDAFGPDAKEFRPERWIEATEEQKIVYERNMMTFGNGTHICIGRHLAMAEMHKLIPHLLYRYTLSFTPRGPGSPHTRRGRSLMQVNDDSEPWHTESGWITTQNDFWVDLTPRNVEC